MSLIGIHRPRSPFLRAGSVRFHSALVLLLSPGSETLFWNQEKQKKAWDSWTTRAMDGSLGLMKRRKKKPADLARRFQTTCGWCGRKIPPDTEVFGGGGKARPGFDLTAHAGKVLPIYFATLDKTVLVAVAGLDSEARREGSDFVYMTCSEDCARSLKTAFEGEIELGKRMGLS
jgi:hypothetical protein